MKAADFCPSEIGAVIALLEAAACVLGLDSMCEPVKLTVALHADAIPAAEYAMRLWGGAKGYRIDEWSNSFDGTRKLAMRDRLNRCLVTLHGAPAKIAPEGADLRKIECPVCAMNEDLHPGDERGSGEVVVQ